MMMQGYNNEDIAPGIDEMMIRQPVGVCAAVAPFNFPAMVPFWFLPYAVVCGSHPNGSLYLQPGSCRRQARPMPGRGEKPDRDPAGCRHGDDHQDRSGQRLRLRGSTLPGCLPGIHGG